MSYALVAYVILLGTVMIYIECIQWPAAGGSALPAWLGAESLLHLVIQTHPKRQTSEETYRYDFVFVEALLDGNIEQSVRSPAYCSQFYVYSRRKRAAITQLQQNLHLYKLKSEIKNSLYAK